MNTTPQILRVAVPSPLRRLFDYLPPEAHDSKFLPGMRVRIPFGRKQLVGVVVQVSHHSDFPLNKLKRICEVFDSEPLFTEPLLTLLLWAADYYHHSLGDVLAQALPTLLRQGQVAALEQEYYWRLTSDGEQIESEKFKRATKQWQALEKLRELAQLPQAAAGISSHELSSFAIKPATLKVLETKKLVEQYKQSKIKPLASAVTSAPVLNTEQQEAVNAILAAQNTFTPFLLEGVTGSGKTEVYLAATQQALAAGQQVLILLPEIGLTPQTLQHFQQRLGGAITVLHSGLTAKERLKTWLLAKNGDISVVIGTRSAIFTPFKRLGMIVVDESHDISFKQWDGFKYHARDLALRRAQLETIPVVLGSATPSLNSVHNALQGRFKHLTLLQRAIATKPVQFTLLDMRRETLEQGIAQTVFKVMAQHLSHGNQVLVFLNRRGYAPVLMCHECGWFAACNRCHAPLTLHRQPTHLHCHHCGKSQPVATQCEQCSSQQLLHIGLGTERVEALLQTKFSEQKIARIDRDSTRKKGALEHKLQQIHSGHAHILIGTQMLAKGHHFPNVTLVVMLDIDGGLYSADYNATERMAQLLLQVSGRAGRAAKPGEVLLQTHHPQHPLLQCLIGQGYHAFARQALQERQATGLPPYRYLALFRAEAVDSTAADAFLLAVKLLLQNAGNNVTLLGPVVAPIEKRVGRYRWQLLLSAAKRVELYYVLKQNLANIETLKESRKVRWSIDIDPVEML